MIETPVKNPKTKKITQVKPIILPDEESQVTIHCLSASGYDSISLRIWKSTFLFSHDSDHKSKLVQALNISMFPDWTSYKSPHIFTLIFSGLPKSCKTFDLLEQIPESGGFSVRNIKRNKSDVYHLDLSRS